MGLEWQKKGNCIEYDPEIFFPEEDDYKAVKRAKAVCQDCPVKLHCFYYAIDTDTTYGIFGGTTYRERQKMLAFMPARQLA